MKSALTLWANLEAARDDSCSNLREVNARRILKIKAIKPSPCHFCDASSGPSDFFKEQKDMVRRSALGHALQLSFLKSSFLLTLQRNPSI